jgi:hypothetical protein
VGKIVRDLEKGRERERRKEMRREENRKRGAVACEIAPVVSDTRVFQVGMRALLPPQVP